MNTIQLNYIASKPFDISKVTFLRTIPSVLSRKRGLELSCSIANNFLEEYTGEVLLGICKGFEYQPPCSTILRKERVYPYMLEKPHSIYQLRCYLSKLKNQGVNIELIIIPSFDLFFDIELLKKLRSGDAELNQQSQIIQELEEISEEFNCYFFLQTTISTPSLCNLSDSTLVYHNLKMVRLTVIDKSGFSYRENPRMHQIVKSQGRDREILYTYRNRLNKSFSKG